MDIVLQKEFQRFSQQNLTCFSRCGSWPPLSSLQCLFPALNMQSFLISKTCTAASSAWNAFSHYLPSKCLLVLYFCDTCISSQRPSMFSCRAESSSPFMHLQVLVHIAAVHEGTQCPTSFKTPEGMLSALFPSLSSIPFTVPSIWKTLIRLLKK